jgi:hypothetical protein
MSGPPLKDIHGQAVTSPASPPLPSCSSLSDPTPRLAGCVIHYTRTRNRFKIVPKGKMHHEAVYLSLGNMNSTSEGGCAVDDEVCAALTCIVSVFDRDMYFCNTVTSCADHSPVTRDAIQVLQRRQNMSIVCHSRHKRRYLFLHDALFFACQASLLQG